jgi:LuxR family transcriptional regulator
VRISPSHQPQVGNDPAEAVIDALEQLIVLAPAGFAIGLHIEFMAARYMFESYPAEWRDIYGRDGLLMRDPTVHWAMHNAGAIRWPALEPQDEARVLERARAFGLVHGHTWSIHEDKGISFGGFARSDRDFTDAEIGEIGALIQRMHDVTHKRVTLGTAASARIRDMAVVMTERTE